MPCWRPRSSESQLRTVKTGLSISLVFKLKTRSISSIKYYNIFKSFWIIESVIFLSCYDYKAATSTHPRLDTST
jgi:hypothetical protein